MKKTLYLCLLLFCVSCAANPDSGTKTNETSDGFTTQFQEYGFAVTTPCVLEDVTSQSKGQTGSNIDANYIGIENPDDSVNTAAYQVTLIKLPTDLEDEWETALNKKIEDAKRAGFTNVKTVEFSDKKYPGFVGDTDKNGCMNRVVLFIKDNHVIELMVSADTDLDQKFERFTNSFKVTDNTK